MFLLHCISVITAQNSTYKTAYFNSTLGSYIHIPTVLRLQSHNAFSFRTCSYGQLLKQTGQSGDTVARCALPVSTSCVANGNEENKKKRQLTENEKHKILVEEYEHLPETSPFQTELGGIITPTKDFIYLGSLATQPSPVTSW